MKRTIALVLVSLTPILAAPQLAPEIPTCLNLSGVVYMAGESSWSSGVTKLKLQRVRFSHKDIMEIVGAPKGACIQVVDRDAPDPDAVVLVDRDGVILEDLTGFVNVETSLEDAIVSGSFNENTSAASGQLIFPIRCTIAIIQGELNAPFDIDMDLQGIAFTRFRAGAENSGGLQRVSASVKSKVSGPAIIGADAAFVEGKCGLSGRGEFDFD
jgi:hypothetical protein